MESLTKNILDKFYGLLLSLKKSKQEFELVADEIGDAPLRTALTGLSEESYYYAGEIKQQLKSLGINTSLPDTYPGEYTETAHECYAIAEGPGCEVNNICTYNEVTLRKAYNDLIEDHIPSQSLKEIMI